MNSNQISTPVAAAIAAVVLIIVVALGYKFFLAPAPASTTVSPYPGGRPGGSPPSATP